MKRGVIFFIFLISCSLNYAQVAEYFFTQPGNTYAALSEETILWSGTFDNDTATVTIPSFTINGNAYTRMTISSNGFLTFGGTAPSPSYYTPISGSTAYHVAISAFGIRLQNAASGTPKVSYHTNVGGEIVVQWQDVRRQAWSGSEVVNFQVRLNPSSGLVSIVYGTCTTDYASTTYLVQVGLRGNSNSDYNNRTTTTNWAATTAGTSSSSSCRFTNAVYPSSGLTFTWKPLYNPVNFIATAINNSRIDQGWQKNSLGHNVMLAYHTSATFGTPVNGTAYAPGNTLPGGGTVLFYGDGTGYSHTGLSTGTLYHYKIWSYDAAVDYSKGTATSGRTGYLLPYLQPFATGTLPAEWSTNMSSTSNHGTAGSYGLNRVLSSSTTTYYAISPLVGAITATTNFSFHYRIVDNTGYPLNATLPGAGDKIDVQVSLDDGATFTTLHTIDQNNHTASTEFFNKVISLSAYSGTFVKIRFLLTWSSGDYYVDIDNVLFEDGNNMSYTNATTEQPNTANIGAGSMDNDIIRLLVVTQKSDNPLTVTSITFNTTGTTSPATSLDSAKVYYTTSPAFSTATRFGALDNPSGTFIVTGNQPLAQGNNYFWLAYDILSSATTGQSVDGQCTQFITSESGTPKSPATTSPSGTRTIGAIIGGTKTIPGDYATLAAAVTALNGGVVGPGGVTFNIAAGHTESSTAPILLTATGTSSEPILFQKSGTGANPRVTHTGTGSATTSTIGNHGDGVIIIEGSDHVTFDSIDVAATDQGVEYGYYLRKRSVTDACKNVTIKNATVNMTRGTSRFVVGICVSNNTTTSNINVTSPGGRHENITLTGNTIDNSFSGIYCKGHNDFKDQGFIIGAENHGNVIQDFGGSVAFECWGIYLIHNTGSLIRYNTINNMNGGGTAFANYATGIYHASTDAVTFTAEYNTINLTSAASRTYGMYCAVTGEVNMNYNGISLSNTGTTNELYAFIYNNQQSATTSHNIYIQGNTFSGSTFNTTGSTYLIYNHNARVSPSVSYIQGNTVSGTISRTGSSGGLYLYQNESSLGTGTEIISGNQFSNISLSGTSSCYGINSSTNIAHSQQVYDNIISNITCGSGNSFMINLLNAGNRSVYGNQVYNITCGGTLSGIISGTGGNPCHIYKNEIYNLTSTSTSTTEGVLNGILVSYGSTTYVYNNYISDLKTPVSPGHDAIRGISLTNNQPNSFLGVYYNTIYLAATSTGANFGTSGLFHFASATSTTSSLDLRNNIIVNKSTPNGSYSNVAFRRTNTSKNNYLNTSNNNILYAGEGSNRMVFYDQTYQYTIEQYRAYIGPNRDSISFSEDPPFINATTAPYNLRLTDGSTSYCESGGQVIAAPIQINDDFDGAARPSTPDIGADEFSGIAAYVEFPGALTASHLNSQQIELAFLLNPDNDDIVIVYNTTGTFTNPTGTPVAGQPLAGGTVVYTGATTPVIHSGLTPGVTVYYRAFCYNGANYSLGIDDSETPRVEPVTNLSAQMVSQTQINLAYTRNVNDHDVMITSNLSYMNGNPVQGTAFSVGDSIPSAGRVIYKGPASSFDHTGLSSWTQYYYKAWSVDLFNYYSSGATANAITDADPVTEYPYVQNFDGTWAHNLLAPPGWQVIDVGGSGTYTWVRLSIINRSSPYAVRGYGNGACDDYLISPPLTLPDTTLRLSWWDLVSDASATNSYKVLLSTTNNSPASFTVELGDFTCTNTDWTRHDIDLSAYRDQTVYLAFHQYFSSSQSVYFTIDDVIVETLIPGPAELVSPMEGLLTFTDPTLAWKAPASSIPIDGYKVYFDANPTPTTLVYDGTALTFTPGSLVNNIDHYWKVVPYNTYGEAESAPVWSFTTVTGTQLAESFEEVYFPPVSWSQEWGWYIDETTGYHGGQSARRYTSATNNPKLITPLLDVKSGDRLEFFEGTASKINNFIRVYYSANKTDWTELGDVIYVTAGSWGFHSMDLSALAGAEYYFAFATWCASGFNAYVYLDHITGPDIVPSLPAAPEDPAPFDTDSYIPSSPTLTWFPGTSGGIPEGYRLYLDQAPNPSTLVYNGTERSFQAGTLDYETTYYWQVIPYNSLGDAASCPVWSFTTAPEGGVQIGRDYNIYDLPIDPNYGYNYSQSIFLQSEINMAGKRIDRIWFHWNGYEEGTYYKDWVIFMGHTDKSGFDTYSDWIPISGLTQVFDGELIIPEEEGWVEIILDVPFDYNNIDNLVIAVDENTDGYGGYSAAFYNTETEDTRSLSYYDDTNNPDPASPPEADDMDYAIPNIRLLLMDAPSTPVLVVSPVSWDFGETGVNNVSNSKSFNIMNRGVGTLQVNNVALGGADAAHFSLVDTNSYPASLSANQSISVSVNFSPLSEGAKTASLDITDDQASDALSQAALTGFGLDETIRDFPFTETFEDNSLTRPYWSQVREAGYGDWVFEEGAGGGSIISAHGGSLNARFFIETYDPDSSKLISPVFDLSGLAEPQLVFWYGQEDWSGDQNKLRVYYRTGALQPWVEIFFDDSSVSEWTEQLLYLPNKSATYQLAFEGIDYYGWGNVLDDITVQDIPAPTTTWTGNVSSDWDDPANWSDGVPGTGHVAVIATGGHLPLIEDSVTILKLIVEVGADITVAPTGVLTVSGN